MTMIMMIMMMISSLKFCDCPGVFTLTSKMLAGHDHMIPLLNSKKTNPNEAVTHQIKYIEDNIEQCSH